MGAHMPFCMMFTFQAQYYKGILLKVPLFYEQLTKHILNFGGVRLAEG
jgi:hypothetical protein